MKLTLTESDVHTIINALTNEAMTCRANAEKVLNMNPRVRDALLATSKEYTDLAGKLGEATEIRVDV